MGKLVFDGAGAESAVGFDAENAVVELETDGVGAVAVVE